VNAGGMPRTAPSSDAVDNLHTSRPVPPDAQHQR
jgi:hypothetical protein